jgi:uncharacterized membrane protein
MGRIETIANRIAPWRFIIFIVLLAISAPAASHWLGSYALGVIAGFDVAATIFLLSCANLFSIEEAAIIESLARKNDANRTFLLFITAIVMVVLLIAVAIETVGKQPQTLTKALIIVTLIVAWLFSNGVYALHYTHMAYVRPPQGCAGFHFPGTEEPVYWDFVYFAFTCGMAFATSDVEITDQRVRKVVTFHCLAAFAFNIGVLAFTVNLLASGH